MKTVRDIEGLKTGKPSVVTVGVFDGVHIGHQLIMKKVREYADQFNACAVAVTFDRNPEDLVGKDGSVPYISTLEQKIELIEEQGIDLTVLLPLKTEILSLSPEQFVKDIICGKLSAIKVVVGTNFTFGRGRAGNVDLLRKMGAEMGFDVIAVPPLTVDNITVSSTLIRKYLQEGDVEKALELLGHPFVLEGTVVEGNRIGRTLGFPTANIKPVNKQVIPGNGIYAVSTFVDGVNWIGVCNIGSRPTVGGESITIEVYIIGYSGNIYGQKQKIAFHHRLRDEIRFAHVDDLIEQIGRDVERTREMMIIQAS